MLVFRRPEDNPPIDIPLEKNKHHMSDGFARTAKRSRLVFSPILPELIEIFEGKPDREPVPA